MVFVVFRKNKKQTLKFVWRCARISDTRSRLHVWCEVVVRVIVSKLSVWMFFSVLKSRRQIILGIVWKDSLKAKLDIFITILNLCILVCIYLRDLFFAFYQILNGTQIHSQRNNNLDHNNFDGNKNEFETKTYDSISFSQNITFTKFLPRQDYIQNISFSVQDWNAFGSNFSSIVFILNFPFKK